MRYNSSIFRDTQDRYRNDPEFHRFVTTIEHMLEALVLSPSEVREAAMYASYLFELRNPRPVPIFRAKEDA